MHAKSTGELISFGFSDRSVQSLVSNEKNDFSFWLIFGLSPNLKLSETLSERLTIVLQCYDTVGCVMF